MRGVRFTKVEHQWLIDVVTTARISTGEAPLIRGKVEPTEKVQSSILGKLSAAGEPATPGVAAGPLEAALIESSHGKIVGVGSNALPRISRQATALGMTVPAARVVGAWIAGQKWLQGPLTIFTVLNKWPDWYARAKVTAAPDGIEEGIGAADVGQGTAPKRPASTAGRRAPGLG